MQPAPTLAARLRPGDGLTATAASGKLPPLLLHQVRSPAARAGGEPDTVTFASVRLPLRSRWFLLASAALLLSRLAFLAPTLGDVDSTNFARALERFDPALHQPHPPGYPIYVALGKLVSLIVDSPPRALAALSAISQALLLLPLLSLFGRLARSPAAAAAATLVTLASPVLWFNGARPMSDSSGLLLVVLTQALLVASLDGRRTLGAASLLVGLAPGVRLQSLLLTAPLWALALGRASSRERTRGLLLGAAGTLLWLAPVVIASGGPGAYLHAFSDTMLQAVASEPLLADLTLNRAAHAARRVLVSPWVSPALAAIVLGLSAIGLLALARRPRALGLALLAFAPYLLAHLLLQHVDTVRYTLLYVPLFGLLAAEGVVELGSWALPRVPERTLAAAGSLALAVWSAALTLPALRAYAGTASPPVAALEQVGRLLASGDYVVSGHYIFGDYLRGLDEQAERLESPPGGAARGLGEYWLGGGSKPVLFVGDPSRTDLESIDPAARQSLGRWSWPFRADLFITGSRPSRAELIRIDPPRWFAGQGFMLSLEAGRLSELSNLPERRAYLRPSLQPSFLMVSGEPIGPAAQYTVDLELDGQPLGSFPCVEPVARGLLLEPADAERGYRELDARTHRAGVVEGAPFALKGLAYGPLGAAALVPAGGWFYPETDEDDRPFRWTSARAVSLVHVPAGGARLTIAGRVPSEYVGAGARLALAVDALETVRAIVDGSEFRLEALLPPGGPPFREVALATDRTFVPDRVQRNGDRRRLGLRIYEIRIEPLS
jgi:hypothetical protein